MPVIVDPKAADYAVYRGATVITPNRKELADDDAARVRRRCSDHRRRREEAQSGSSARRPCWCSLSEEGLMLCRRAGRAGPRAGLSGEGDGRVGRGRYGGGDPRRDARGRAPTSRSRCASPMRPAPIVVGKPGTATVSVDELRHRLLPASTLAAEDKIVFDRAVLDAAARRMAPSAAAHRLHQWLLRSPASRAHQADGRGALGLRPAGGRPQQRCVGHAPQGRGAADPGRRPRAPKCSPRSKRSISSWCSRRTRRWS